MKSFAVLAMCCVGAQAFVPVPKPGPVPSNAPCRGTSSALEAKSKALPFLESPATLDGTMTGDFGFDPLGLTENIDLPYGERGGVHAAGGRREREREIGICAALRKSRALCVFSSRGRCNSSAFGSGVHECSLYRCWRCPASLRFFGGPSRRSGVAMRVNYVSTRPK